MRILPWALLRIGIILDVLDVLPALEQQDIEPFLRELLRGPASGDAGSDNDRIVRRALHQCPPRSSLRRLQVQWSGACRVGARRAMAIMTQNARLREFHLARLPRRNSASGLTVQGRTSDESYQHDARCAIRPP